MYGSHRHLAAGISCRLADVLLILGSEDGAVAVLKSAIASHKILMKKQYASAALATLVAPEI